MILVILAVLVILVVPVVLVVVVAAGIGWSVCVCGLGYLTEGSLWKDPTNSSISG